MVSWGPSQGKIFPERKIKQLPDLRKIFLTRMVEDKL